MHRRKSSQYVVAQSGGGNDLLQTLAERCTDGAGMFRGGFGVLSKLSYDILNGLNWSRINLGLSTNSMFHSENSLNGVPLFDTSNVNDMQFMFYNCSKLTTVPLFDTSNVKNMQYMFYGCSSLTSVPLFDLSEVTRTGNTFQSCVRLAQFETATLKIFGYSMFLNCENLTKIIIRLTNQVVTLENTNAFNNTPIARGTGYIYVPDELVNDYKTDTNWSTYANQIKGLSELPS